jgi:hypothetical protein
MYFQWAGEKCVEVLTHRGQPGLTNKQNKYIIIIINNNNNNNNNKQTFVSCDVFK